jgi:CheY-like chemotaxis protein
MRRQGEHQSARILVVDDEPDMCWALDNILSPAGYAVTTTTKGAEALYLLTAGEPPYAAAFVDAKLPDLDGLELAALIRQQIPGVSVVLLSGYYYPEDSAIIEGLQQGLFVGFVTKPFDLHQVCLLAHQAVNKAHGC